VIWVIANPPPTMDQPAGQLTTKFWTLVEQHATEKVCETIWWEWNPGVVLVGCHFPADWL
jgi:hypothetical protein